MRLLKTGPYTPGNEELEMIQKWGEDIPPYAILSHTWTEHEVLFSDVQQGTYASKAASLKLTKALERARLDGFGWLWIDTCCIDKSSSVELSEAINSMYSYYQQSQKCYAYLADVESEKVGEAFRNALWWRRGWTLQELLAPCSVEFFNRDWRSLGYKDSLHEIITEITGIDHDYLSGGLPIEHASIAKRMSWAASRATTREEDIAYSLIGMFDVNMPMLYGEGGNRAFLRLQEEILKVNEDESIFAWTKGSGTDTTVDGNHGLLADCPKDFEATGDVISYIDNRGHNPSTMTARGLLMSLPLTPLQDGKLTVVAALHCLGPGQSGRQGIGVYIRPISGPAHQYARVECDRLVSVSQLGTPRQVYIRQRFPRSAPRQIYPGDVVQLRSLVSTDHNNRPIDYKIVGFQHSQLLRRSGVPLLDEPQPWKLVPQVYEVTPIPGHLTVALLIQRSYDKEAFMIMLGVTSTFGTGGGIGVAICEAKELGPNTELPKVHHYLPRFDRDLVLGHHRVRIHIEERVRTPQKIHFVDINISAIQKTSTAAERIFQGTAALLATPSEPAAKPGLRDKAKKFWQN